MKKIVIAFIGIVLCFAAAGCTEADRVQANLTQEADNFNIYRELTVIDCITGDTLFQMTGKMSITADTSDNQLEIIVEGDDGRYRKHFVGLSDNVTYVIEDITGANVSRYQYSLNFNPKMWLWFTPDYVD